jgi:hypothetical protein
MMAENDSEDQGQQANPTPKNKIEKQTPPPLEPLSKPEKPQQAKPPIGQETIQEDER